MIGTIVTALVVVPLFLFSVFALLLDYLVSPTRRLKRILVAAKGTRTIDEYPASSPSICNITNPRRM
jgi:hypothetical protein